MILPPTQFLLFLPSLGSSKFVQNLRKFSVIDGSSRYVTFLLATNVGSAIQAYSKRAGRPDDTAPCLVRILSPAYIVINDVSKR